MNKKELIKIISKEANISDIQAKIVIETLIREIIISLNNGEIVRLTGFGSLSVRKRSERLGRNPQTGQSILIAAKNVVKFKSSENLTNKNNGGGTIGGGARRKKQ